MSSMQTGIHGRLGRYVLGVLAVVVGVALAAGAVFVRASLQSSSKDWTDTLLSADVYIKPQDANLADVLMKPMSSQQFVGSATAAMITGTPEAAATYTAYIGRVTLLTGDGQLISSGLAPSIGISMDDKQVESGRLADGGAWPAKVTEVVLEKATADRAGLRLHDQVRVVAAGSSLPAEITGIVTYPSSLGGANLVILNTIAAKAFFSSTGMMSYVAVKGAEGTTPQQLAEAVAGALEPGTNAQVVLGSTVRQEVVDQVGHSMDWLTIALIACALVGVGVGGFLLANTFAGAQNRRLRQIELMKTLGASTGQVLRSVVGQAVVVGLIGSLIGIAVGFGLSWLALGQAGSRGLELVVGWPLVGLAGCLVGGVLVSVLAAVIGAWRVSALTPPSRTRSSASFTVGVVRVIIGVALLGVGVLVLVLWLRQGNWLYAGGGAACLGLGVVLIGSVLMIGLAPVFAAPARVFSALSARLALSGIRRDPRRAANAAGVLVVTMAVASAGIMLLGSTHAAEETSMRQEVTADYIIQPSQPNAVIPDSVVAQISQKVDAQIAAFGLAPVKAKLPGQDEPTEATVWFGPPTTFAGVAVGTAVIEGAVTDFPTGVAVNQAFAQAHDLKIGDVITFLIASNTPNQAQAGLPITLIIDTSVFGDMVLPLPWLTQQIPSQLRSVFVPSTMVFVTAADAVEASALRDQLAGVLDSYHSFTLRTAEDFTAMKPLSLTAATIAAYAMGVLGVVLAWLALACVMGRAVSERQSDFAMVKALGATGGQVRRAVVLESVLIAVIGCLIGLAVGVGLAFAAAQAWSLSITIPWLWLGGLLVASIVVGLIAPQGAASQAAQATR